MSESEPFELSASEMADRIRHRTLTSVELVSSCLANIRSRESEVRAWAYLDADAALAQAADRDRQEPTGALHGVPVGIKDMIDTGDQPTSYNSPIYENHQPARDAACVSILRSAGAVILGKTDTVEFASLGRNAATTNPYDPTRTPGGSSSGSGAAVGSQMVPLALGTQTGGSTIRPASFCGVAAYKPTFGLISTEGIKVYAQSLDTIGVIGSCASDLWLAAGAFGIVDGAERDISAPRSVGLYRTPHWDEADADSQRTVLEAAAALEAAGTAVTEIKLPTWFGELTEAQDVVMHWEGRAAYRSEFLRVPDRLHPNFHDEVNNAKQRTPDDVRGAHDLIGRARVIWEEAVAVHDAVLTPAVVGEAPVGLESTGMATFNRMFTALAGPNVTVPGGTGSHDLPIGVQFVGGRFDDLAVLETARWAEGVLATA